MIPAPAWRTARAGHFTLTDGPPSAEPGLAAVARWLTGVLRRTGGITLRTDPALPPEGYTLDVDAAGVVVTGGSPAGVHHGVQTLRSPIPSSAPGQRRTAAVIDAALRP
jgi:hexosaminidase